MTEKPDLALLKEICIQAESVQPGKVQQLMPVEGYPEDAYVTRHARTALDMGFIDGEETLATVFSRGITPEGKKFLETT